MKYISTLALAAGLATATDHVMSATPPGMAPGGKPPGMAPGGKPPGMAPGAMTHTVVVGGVKPVETGMAPVLGYSPEAITANIGDVVQFHFMQKNHTVTQSTFGEPCKKKADGLDSGFKPNPEGKAGVQWEMTVTTMEALWFYCKQQNGVHCGKGMVFSINAEKEGDKTMSAFKQLAIKQNGTEQAPLSSAGIQSAAPGAQAAPSTVTVKAGGTGAPTASVAATGTGSSAAATASVAAGQGVDGSGQTCSCQCLCGMNSFPSNAAINAFGGFAGMIA